MFTRSLVAVYVSTMFLSALLLFFVQPLVGKLLIPLLGGAPATWNTCMLFFQGMLLAGYLYAHALNRLSLPKQLGVHVVMMGAAALALPLTAPTGAPEDGAAIGWLLWTLFGLVGAPFFAISTTAPLLQSWFSRTTHPTAQDPYHLYAASNLGSMTSLLAYPFIIEPLTQLQTQTHAWSVGFVVLYVALGLCGVMALNMRRKDQPVEVVEDTPVEGITLKDVGLWIFLSFVPSSLMLGTTSYITTDIASVPMLWLLPLALYLLTFIIVFSNKIKLDNFYLSRIATALVPTSLIAKSLPNIGVPAPLLVTLSLMAMFLLTLLYHANLASIRPPAKHLTAFFLFVSLGGVLGGVFNALIAPLIFESLTEDWLVLVVGAIIGLWSTKALGHTPHKTGPLGWSFAFVLAVLTVWVAHYIDPYAALIVGVFIVTFTLFVVVVNRREEAREAAGLSAPKEPMSLTQRRVKAVVLGAGIVAMIVGFGLAVKQRDRNVIYRERSFFGAHLVNDDENIVKLVHGTTVHGMQDKANPQKPLSYYSRTGPLGDILADPNAKDLKVSVIGLGAGTIATYHTQGHSFVLYEIDPVVIKIAKNPKFFTFLQTCASQCKVEEGDGRLEFVRKGEPASQDVLILDAYSSDAIPVHLSTFEALTAYWKKMKPSGMIAFHISNRYFELEPVLAKLAQETGAVAYHRDHDIEMDKGALVYSSSWVVMGRDEASMAKRFGADKRWVKQTPLAETSLWTDSYSNILGALK